MRHPQLEFAFRVLAQTRVNVTNMIARFEPHQLNTIPEGFSNNLIWNAGHLLVTQQLLVYGLSDLPMRISEEWVERFRKGSRPDGAVGLDEIKTIREALLSLPEQTHTDLVKGQFSSQPFKIYPTSFGVTLHNVQEAIAFNNVHEGLHLGAMMALAKKVSA